MFHCYITTSCGNRVDIDRATFLMDKTIFSQVMDELYYSVIRSARKEYSEPFDQECAIRSLTQDLPQNVWALYCERYYEKYGSPFEPDIKPDWDS